MLEYLLLLLSLLHATVRDRDALVAENLLLRHQLGVLTRPTRRRARLRARDKLFWVLVRALRSGDWRRHLILVEPESVIRWHRQAWRLFWRWRSRGPIGRPRLSAEVRELIGTLRRECLDHLIILDEQHLRSVLTEFVSYYNLDRPHRTLRLETPVPALRQVNGPVRSRPVLGGLHHVYERVA
jgi:transposase InsO family protein